MIVGYSRVSTADQREDRQLDQLTAFGVEKIFSDVASGKDVDRPGFEKLMTFLREGDELVVCSMDRLARNLQALLQVVQTLREREVGIRFLKEGIAFQPGEESPVATLTLQIMGAVAEFERQLIRERQREGIALAKKRGAYRGRKPISEDIVRELRARSAAGVPATRIARDLGIGVNTCYRYLRNEKKD